MRSILRLKRIIYVLIPLLVLGQVCPFCPSIARAQDLPFLPSPGMMVTLSPVYHPAILKGFRVFPDSPFRLDFIVDYGDSRLQGEALNAESSKLIKYFLAALTVPEQDLWVNLSPYEKDRIIPEVFGQTEMGRDLLAQDYILKQISASLVHPEEGLGKKFWERVRAKAQAKYGTTEIPVNTFNKVWIVPDKALVYENGDTVLVAKSRLKVMLEEDYLALNTNMDKVAKEANDDDVRVMSNVSSGVLRDIILPELEREVNEGENFAPLRQVYHSMLLATWFKRNLQKSVMTRLYVDKRKVFGIDLDDKEVAGKIYDQYLQAFKKGVYNFIKEDFDSSTQEMIPRKYFSGGFNGGNQIVEGTNNPATVQPANGPLGNIVVQLDYTRKGHQASANDRVAGVLDEMAKELGLQKVAGEYRFRAEVQKQEGLVLRLRDGGEIRLEGDVLVFVDPRFSGADHAGRDRNAVYASDANKVQHEKQELLLIGQFASEQGIDMSQGLGLGIRRWAKGKDVNGDQVVSLDTDEGRAEILRRQNLIRQMDQAWHNEGLRAEGREDEVVTTPAPQATEIIDDFDWTIAGEGPGQQDNFAARVRKTTTTTEEASWRISYELGSFQQQWASVKYKTTVMPSSAPPITVVSPDRASQAVSDALESLGGGDLLRTLPKDYQVALERSVTRSFNNLGSIPLLMTSVEEFRSTWDRVINNVQARVNQLNVTQWQQQPMLTADQQERVLGLLALINLVQREFQRSAELSSRQIGNQQRETFYQYWDSTLSLIKESLERALIRDQNLVQTITGRSLRMPSAKESAPEGYYRPGRLVGQVFLEQEGVARDNVVRQTLWQGFTEAYVSVDMERLYLFWVEYREEIRKRIDTVEEIVDPKRPPPPPPPPPAGRDKVNPVKLKPANQWRRWVSIAPFLFPVLFPATQEDISTEYVPQWTISQEQVQTDGGRATVYDPWGPGHSGDAKTGVPFSQPGDYSVYVTEDGQYQINNWGTIAVDPAVIPLGSLVTVQLPNGETYYFMASDTGGAVRGNHIDFSINRTSREDIDSVARTFDGATVWSNGRPLFQINRDGELVTVEVTEYNGMAVKDVSTRGTLEGLLMVPFGIPILGRRKGDLSRENKDKILDKINRGRPQDPVNVTQLARDMGVQEDDVNAFLQGQGYLEVDYSEEANPPTETMMLRPSSLGAASSSDEAVTGEGLAVPARGDSNDNLGGIDLTSRTLEFEVQRQGRGMAIPVDPADLENIRIDGLLPVIINITPIPNMQMLLGRQTVDPTLAQALPGAR